MFLFVRTYSYQSRVFKHPWKPEDKNHSTYSVSTSHRTQCASIIKIVGDAVWVNNDLLFWKSRCNNI
jgi:hypothetical protein